MTKNEKALWFLITLVGVAVIWLWLRGSEKGRNIINQISEALNLPGLSAPVIDIGDTGDYDFDLAEMPSPISTDKGCCPTCQDITIARLPRPPYEIARPQPPVVYESIRYQTVYQPAPSKKSGLGSLVTRRF